MDDEYGMIDHLESCIMLHASESLLPTFMKLEDCEGKVKLGHTSHLADIIVGNMS